MIAEIKREVDHHIAPLLKDIVRDGQSLIRQEIALAKSEVRQEVNKVKSAAIMVAAATAFAAIGGFFLLIASAHLISWAFPDIPLWGSYGIVGGLLAIVGGVLFYLGKNRASDVHVVPPKTVETMKENAEWLKRKI
jgi:hypothetical protein